MQIVKVQQVVAYVSPIGFHQYAADFVKWADRASAEPSQFFSPVPYYLYCHSIELSLKAFLLARGITKKKLKDRRYGHDLIALLNKAKQLGLEDIVPIRPEWESELSKANDYYFHKEFEYFNVGFFANGLPLLVDLRELSQVLIKSLKRVCLDAADAPGIPT